MSSAQGGCQKLFYGKGVGTTQYGSISVKMFFDTVPYSFLTNYFHSLGILWQAEGFHRLPKSSQLFKRGSSPQARPCWQVYKLDGNGLNLSRITRLMFEEEQRLRRGLELSEMQKLDKLLGHPWLLGIFMLDVAEQLCYYLYQSCK